MIVVITRTAPPFVEGGLGVHVRSHLRALSETNTPAVCLLLLYGSRVSASSYEYAGIPVFPIPFACTKNGDDVHFLPKTVRYLGYFANKIASNDILHGHEWFGWVVGNYLKSYTGAKLITTMHLSQTQQMLGGAVDFENAKGLAIHEKPEARDEREFAIQCESNSVQTGTDLTVHVSQAMQDLFRENYRPSVPSKVIHNCVDQEFYDALQREIPYSKIHMGFPEDACVFVATGRFTQQKGFLPLLHAFWKALDRKDRSKDIRLLVIGEGEELVQYQEFVRMSGTDEYVKILPFQSLTEYVRYLGAADVGVVPSIYEPFGLVAVEYAAAGLPVIASRAGGLPEIVRDGQTGLLVDCNPSAKSIDLEQLTEAICNLTANKQIRESMSRHADVDVICKFPFCNFRDELDATYREVQPHYKEHVIDWVHRDSTWALDHMVLEKLMRRQEGHTLFELARLTSGDALEIGSLQGYSTAWIAWGVSKRSESLQGKVHAVDPFIMPKAFQEENDIAPDVYTRKIIGSFIKTIKSVRLGKYVKLHKIKSKEFFVGSGEDKVFGFVHIDGDHSYDAVKYDFLQSVQRLQKGGVIAIHDTGPLAERYGHTGPQRVIDEYVIGDPAFSEVKRVHTMSYFTKLKEPEWLK